MRWSLPLLLSLLPLRGLAGKHRNLRSRQCKQPSAVNSTIITTTQPGSTYTIDNFYSGQSFFSDDPENGWNFFVDKDPTDGNVQYLSRDDAMSQGLAYVRADGVVVLSVDATTKLTTDNPKRKSVRIASNKFYNGGLFIADFAKMPYGCSLWPAYWSVGPNWPNAGEIDIIEGVNDKPGITNQMTLHTGEGCNLPQNANSLVEGSTLLRTSCVTRMQPNGLYDNSGCAFLDNSPQSYGKVFNDNGGGVFAHAWDATGITVWRFFRGSIPDDITAKTPDPSKWGKPVAQFPSTECDMASHFFQHYLVMDTTLCGQWAGSVYKDSGCPLTCAEFVAEPTNFINAVWEIISIAVYQKNIS